MTSVRFSESQVHYDNTRVHEKVPDECPRTLVGKFYLQGHGPDFFKANALKESGLF